MPSGPLPREPYLPPGPPPLARVCAHLISLLLGGRAIICTPPGPGTEGRSQVSVKCINGIQSLFLPGSSSHPRAHRKCSINTHRMNEGLPGSALLFSSSRLFSPS